MTGKLKKDDFKAIVNEHPEILRYIREGIFEYQDKDMRFIKMALKQLPFFSHLKDTNNVFYEIIYSLETVKKNMGDTFIEIGSAIDNIYIVEDGIVEIYLKIHGTEVILERLFRGSVINYKSMFIPEQKA